MAACDFILKIEGVDGESNYQKAAGAIDIEAWNWAEAQAGSHANGSGGGTGKVNMHDLHFTMKVNKASAKLALACASGEHLKKALLICRKAGKEQFEYLKITLSDVLVSSFQMGGSSRANVVPLDQCSLNYAKIEWEYRTQKQDGSLGPPIKTGWELKTNRAV